MNFLHFPALRQYTNSLFDACHHVNPPVGLYSPAQLLTRRDLLEEMLPGLVLILFLLERLSQVAHVLCSTQLGDAREQHEGEKRDQQARVGTQGEVCLGASVLKESKARREYIHLFSCTPSYTVALDFLDTL